MKIPAACFRDYSDDGALYTILEVLLQFVADGDLSPSRFRDPARVSECLLTYDKVKLALEKVCFVCIFTSPIINISVNRVVL